MVEPRRGLQRHGTAREGHRLFRLPSVLQEQIGQQGVGRREVGSERDGLTEVLDALAGLPTGRVRFLRKLLGEGSGEVPSG